jgi:predicted nucleic acid-binding Zn ribbon protein
MKSSNEQPIKNVIDDLLNLYGIREKYNEYKINTNWEKMMGKMIAKHTVRIYVSKKIMYVNLDSAALRQELSFAKKKIIDKLNKIMGEHVVDEIVFK